MKILINKYIIIFLILIMAFSAYGNQRNYSSKNSSVVTVIVGSSIGIISTLIITVIRKRQQRREKIMLEEEERKEEQEIEEERKRLAFEADRLERIRIHKSKKRDKKAKLSIVKLKNTINSISMLPDIEDIKTKKIELDELIRADNWYLHDHDKYKNQVIKLAELKIKKAVNEFLRINKSIFTAYEDKSVVLRNTNMIKNLKTKILKLPYVNGEILEYRNKNIQLYGNVSDAYTKDKVNIMVSGVKKTDITQHYDDLNDIFGQAYGKMFGGLFGISNTEIEMNGKKIIYGVKYVSKEMGINNHGGAAPIYYYTMNPDVRKLLTLLNNLKLKTKTIQEQKFKTLCLNIKGYTPSKNDEKNLLYLKTELTKLGWKAKK